MHPRLGPRLGTVSRRLIVDGPSGLGLYLVVCKWWGGLEMSGTQSRVSSFHCIVLGSTLNQWREAGLVLMMSGCDGGGMLWWEGYECTSVGLGYRRVGDFLMDREM